MASYRGSTKDLRLDDVLDSLRARTQTESTKGLTNLKLIFDSKTFKTLHLDRLTLKSYNEIFDALFKLVIEAKKNFLNSKKNTAEKAAARLTTCAEALYAVIRAGNTTLKQKTSKAVIEHITQALPTAEGLYHPTLGLHYVKILAAVLKYQPHVEHLSDEDWLATVDFCLTSLDLYYSQDDEESMSRGGTLGTMASSSRSAASVSANKPKITKRNADELVECLQSLVVTPNAPISKRYKELSTTIIQFLRTRGAIVDPSHQRAFSAINAVFSYASVADTVDDTGSASSAHSTVRDLVPLITGWWSAKVNLRDEMLNNAKDEMLIFLLRSHSLLQAATESWRPGSQVVEFLQIAQDLRSTLRDEYSRRSNRDHLQHDDLELSTDDKMGQMAAFSLHNMYLRSHTAVAERNWALVQVLGYLESCFDGSLQRGASKRSENEDGEDSEDDRDTSQPRKRRKADQEHYSALDLINSGTSPGIRLTAIQTLTFLVGSSNFSARQLDDVLSELVPCIHDAHTEIVSWSMLAIASCTVHFSLTGEETKFDWLALWQTAAKFVPIPATCRSACHLLHSILARNLVQFRDVAEAATAMISSADISTPATLCDASLSLMSHLLGLVRVEVPSASLGACKDSLKWLFSKWDTTDKLFMSRSHVNPIDILNLLCTCLRAERPQVATDVAFPSGVIGQAWRSHLRFEDTIRYVLLQEPMSIVSAGCCLCFPSVKQSESERAVLTKPDEQMQRLVLDLLVPKYQSLMMLYLNGESSRASPEMLGNAASIVVTGCLTYTLVEQAQGNHLSNLGMWPVDLGGFIIRALQQIGESWSAVGEISQQLRPYLPSIHSSTFMEECRKDAPLQQFVVNLAEKLSRSRLASPEARNKIAEDSMDLDDDFETEVSQNRSDNTKFDLGRQDDAICWTPTAFQATFSAHLALIHSVHSEQEQTTLVPSIFIDHLLSLEENELLFCRSMIQELVRSDLSISVTDTNSIMNWIGRLVNSYPVQCSEVMFGLVLGLLGGLVPKWCDGTNADLTDAANDLYEWLIPRVFHKRLVRLSVGAQIGLANLLLDLLQIQPDFGVSISAKMSARTCYFDLLKEGDLRAKFHIGNRIPQIFELDDLKKHKSVLQDVVDCLPLEDYWVEALSFRLRVLSLIASRWPTLLRNCVYHIFEVPGNVYEATNHARRCISDVSKALSLRQPRELLRLFASQTLYTWLQKKEIEDIPFPIFGYKTLEELLHDVQEDAIALLWMRGQQGAAEKLAELLNTPLEELLRGNFTKVMAYSVAVDMQNRTSSPRKLKEKGESAEKRLQSELGPGMFQTCVQNHFVDIVATFYQHLDTEEAVEEAFEEDLEDDSGLFSAAQRIRQMKAVYSSEALLPPCQQPEFKPENLADQIEHVSRQTQFEVRKMYGVPAMVTAIARKLLSTIHQSLGSLHTCAIIRKLRVLIAVVGPEALEGYPLEMLLHSIRPYVTDAECAADTLGIMRWLLETGIYYLQQRPSFLAGMSISTLLSVRSFLDSTKSSTTQDSQHVETLSKAQNFHTWFGKYLSRYSTAALPDEQLLKRMVKAAHESRRGNGVGNHKPRSPESRLLAYVIGVCEDPDGGRMLLNRPSQKLVFSLLCSDFEQPHDFGSDFLGPDEGAVLVTPLIWELSRTCVTNKSFNAWIARALGRGFLTTGQVKDDLFRESGISQATADFDFELSSAQRILRLLGELALGDDPHAAEVAEATLRLINPDGIEDSPAPGVLSDAICKASSWAPYPLSPSDVAMNQLSWVEEDPYNTGAITQKTFMRDLTIELCMSIDDPILSRLPGALSSVEGFAHDAFPFILHQVLDLAHRKVTQVPVKQRLSVAFREWLSSEDKSARSSIKRMIESLLYLRMRVIPYENSSADRLHWLDIDYSVAAKAAARCRMFKTALLFIEISVSEQSRTSRRSSTVKVLEPTDLLLEIFQNIDEPDSYYGVEQQATLSSILSRLEFEQAGQKNLSFRGARYDSHLRSRDPAATSDAGHLVAALGMLNLDGLARSMLNSQDKIGLDPSSRETLFRASRRLEQWDIPVPAAYEGVSGNIYKALQTVNTATERDLMVEGINDALRTTLSGLEKNGSSALAVRQHLQSLAIMAEIHEVITSKSKDDLEKTLERFQSRQSWMKTGRYEDVGHITSCRDITMSSLSRRPELREIVNVEASDARLMQVKSMLLSSNLYRAHGALQESLTSAAHLSSMIQPCKELDINIEAVASMALANALWEQGEMATSIQVLRDLDQNFSPKDQAIPVGKADLLARIGYQVSEARLEKSDKIMERYLSPALKELKGREKGTEAGQVYHEFALFCDQQLQDSDNLEDLERLRKLKEMKELEVQDLSALYQTPKLATDQRNKYGAAWKKAKQWLTLDTQEYERLSRSRDELLRHSLKNYLLALVASDEHDNDALRCTALWLECSDQDLANEAVEAHLDDVPSHKFASLMNQLTSRLLDESNRFQRLLVGIIGRICTDHPYHGMYQIWTSVKTKSHKDDETAVSRQKAAKFMQECLMDTPATSAIYNRISETNRVYCELAGEQSGEGRWRQGQKIPVKDSPAAAKLNNMLPRFPIPSPTAHIAIRPDKDYSSVPTMTRLEPTVSIANGVSAPKIITIVSTDGSKYRQLVKGGNDDLRQDAIMEQVFGQVSELLKTNRSTRQRNLGIRTYKVLPLISVAGIIEFVPNSIPFNDYLLPAHERYYPKDIKQRDARKAVSDVQSKRLDAKVKVFREVRARFNPVMRYFFMEHFLDPDRWFAARIAYARTTAAISVLGYILGIGDRHGHNILLDHGTGEVVHIDLGVAFETGRVLPVPELVPFRLTKDVIDGMGITKTEGVYRRCCEFTLDALRKESYSIMTILDVLRYDPLYSWSINPARLAKLQDAAAVGDGGGVDGKAGAGKGEKGGERVNEPSEAERALEVVRKKLSKTLSVEATVNDLINQATDERNLAALYAGWAAWV